MRTLVFEDGLFQMPSMTRNFFPRKICCADCHYLNSEVCYTLFCEAQRAEHVVCMPENKNVSGIFV
jgi:hypothetical protein